MRDKSVILIIATVTAILLSACTVGQDEAANMIEDSADDRISIVATIFPLYDFARAVTGSEADLVMLVDPGTEIHSYDPTPADIVKIREADVFIYIGGENDAWVGTILDSLDNKDIKIIRMMDYVNAVEEETVEGMESAHQSAEEGQACAEIEYDEHIWTSPANAILMINAIAEVLTEGDPENGSVYKDNAQEYIADIQKIDDEIKGIVEEGKHNLLVFGDRFPFRYFTDEFGLEYRAAFNGCSSETEVSAGTLAYLIDTVRKNDIPFVYYIELSNQSIAKSIGEHTGAGLLLLHSCQSVSKADFEAGVTYASLMRGNAENLRKGLE